jgi:hypothetical protein
MNKVGMGRKLELSGSLFSLVLLWLTLLPAAGQSRLERTEKELVRLYDQIRQAKDDAQKITYNDSVVILFRTILPEEGSFLYPFSSLRYTGKLYAPDSTFRIINWNLPLTDGTYRYFGFICRPDGQVTELHDRSREIPHPQDTLLSPEHWYGALYYRILKNRWRNKTWYTLLGIVLHNSLITRKVIDVLSFDKKGRIQFGAPVFNMGDSVLTRVVFAFNAQVAMLLHYDEEMKMIVFDHLSPAQPEYKGMYQFYGPDSSYDGFFFYKGKWYLREDLDVRNRE